jgi:hypothetical protein
LREVKSFKGGRGGGRRPCHPYLCVTSGRRI